MKIKISLIFSILFILLLLLLNYRLIVFNINHYDNEYKKLDVYNKFGREKAIEETGKIINFFKYKDGFDTDFLNEKEKAHLKDVRNLITKTNYLFYALTIILALMVIINKNKIFDFKLFLSALIGCIILFFIIFISFDTFFLVFHKAVFSNDYWLLNQETDNLIALLSPKFMYDSFFKIITRSFLISLFFLLILAIRKRKFTY